MLILKDFNDITNTLSGNSYVTLSLVYPTMSHLISKIKSQLYEEDDIESSDEFIPSPDIDEIILEPPNSNETEGSSIDDATEEMDALFMQADENEDGEIEILEEQNGERLKKKIKISKPIETYGLKNKILNALYNSLINYWSVTPQIGLLAAALDPRFKSLKFASGHREITYKILSEELESIKGENPGNSRRTTVVIQKITIFDELLLLDTTQIVNDDEL